MILSKEGSAEGYSRTKRILWLGFLSLLLYLSGFLVWLTPLPILYGYKKGGRQLAFFSLGLAILGLLLIYQVMIPLLGPKEFFIWMPGMGFGESSTWNPLLYGLSYYAFYGFVGILLGKWEPHESDVARLVGVTSGIITLGIFLWLMIQTRGDLAGLISEVEQYFLDLLNQMTRATEGDDQARQQLVALATYQDRIVYYAVRLMPGMIINTTLFVVWLNLFVSSKVFYKEKMFPKLENLKKWRFSFSGIWAVILFAAVFLLDIYLLHTEWIKIIALNAFLIFALIYFFQGLAITAFYGQKWSMPPLAKLIFYVLFILFIQPIAFLLIAFGFFDSWFDFRKLTPKTT